jgi:hypothetical protein
LTIWEAEQPLSSSAAVAIVAATVRFIVDLSGSRTWISHTAIFHNEEPPVGRMAVELLVQKWAQSWVTVER